jgi:hypothetical protein
MTKIETTDLEKALDSFPADTQVEGRLEKTVEKVLDRLLKESDLTNKSTSDLDVVDQVPLYRSTHILSLVRLAQYLRKKAENIVEERAQAQVALGFVRLMDANRLAALQLGRSKSDGNLGEDVTHLRAQLTGIAFYKAKAIAARGGNGEADAGREEETASPRETS